MLLLLLDDIARGLLEEESMKIVRCRLRILLAEKADRERRTISLRKATRETGVPISTIMGLANNTIKEVPLESLAILCSYLNCNVGEILRLEDA